MMKRKSTLKRKSTKKLLVRDSSDTINGDEERPDFDDVEFEESTDSDSGEYENDRLAE